MLTRRPVATSATTITAGTDVSVPPTSLPNAGAPIAIKVTAATHPIHSSTAREITPDRTRTGGARVTHQQRDHSDRERARATSANARLPNPWNRPAIVGV